MPTTILDGETYLEALQRRYAEEAKVEERMTQDEIIRMAREAGIIFEPMTIDGIEYEYRYVRCSDSIGEDEADCIERFAAIVFEAGCTYGREKLTVELINEAQREVQRAVLAEREACAKVCEEVGPKEGSLKLITEGFAAAIRARSII